MSIRIHKALKKQRQSAPSIPSVDFQRILGDVLADFKTQARESIQKLVQELFEEEVQKVAGASHIRGRCQTQGVFRAGSDPGSVKVSGQRMSVRKPRLKQDGKEVTLETYRLLQDWDLLTPRILEHMVHGVSTRSYGKLLEEIASGLNLSKSSVSRAFNRGSKQALEHLQKRDLTGKRFAAVMIDGIHFASRNIIVAIGIDSCGKKVILGLKDGNTESAAVCVDFLQKLVERGLKTEKRFIFVIDGGRGIHSAIRRVFGEDFPIQRCLIHKARNIEEYIPQAAYVEFRRRFKKMRSLDNYGEAEKERKSLREWLARINSTAAASLDEAGDELLTVIRIGVDPYLRGTITNTNQIESIFSTVRHRTQRIKKWTDSPDQCERWVAVCLLHAERTLHSVKGYYSCNAFIENVEKLYLPNAQQVA